jgi:hemolysin III
MSDIQAKQRVTTTKHYSLGEEIANSISHGAGVVFGVLALFLLLISAVQMNDALRIASAAIYGVSIILLFLASTLYHAVQHHPTKSVLKLLDHCAIYLLIAGSYTPFLLLTLGGGFGAVLMVVVWTIAVAGILFKLFSNHRFHNLSVITYLAMGWFALVGAYQLAMNLHWAGIGLLVAGGVIYSLGVIFYQVERIPFNHAIWHLFVLGGCVCHFLAVYYFVLPLAA